MDNLAQRAAQHSAALSRAEARIAHAEKLMQEVRDLGRYPKRAQWSKGEGKLASDVLIARGFKQFSPEQEAELEALQQAEGRKNWGEEGEKLMRQVRDLGGYLMDSTNRSLMERQLAERLRRAWKGFVGP